MKLTLTKAIIIFAVLIGLWFYTASKIIEGTRLEEWIEYPFEQSSEEK